MSNFSKYQAEKRQLRSDLIDRILERARRGNMKFDKVTFLARYVAEEISKVESSRSGVPNRLAVEGNTCCRYTTLLKSKLYRAQLNSWIGAQSGIQDKAQLQVEQGLRLELARLSVQYRRMEYTVLELQRKIEESSEGEGTSKGSTGATESTGLFVAVALIKEFSDLLSCRNGVLSTKSAFVSRELVPEKIFKDFLAECKGHDISIDL